MENAAKALTIAGTILISLIVISALIFMFREIRGIKSQDASNQKTQQIIDFNKSYESYNKTLYGSELLSLANKMSDYNKGLLNKYGANKDGYEDMNLEVKFKNELIGKNIEYFTNLIEENDKLMEKYKSSNYLEGLYKAYDIITGNLYIKTSKEYTSAEKQRDEILSKIGKTDSDIKSNINNDYGQYEKYQELKTKRFKCTETTYSDNGRIQSMTFEEI